MRARLQAWVASECAGERKADDTEEQFYYKSRKKAIGPFKRELWDLPVSVRDAMASDLERTFAFLFEQLRVTGTRELVARHVRAPAMHRSEPRPATVSAPDDADAGE